jgi:hypothetical protein
MTVELPILSAPIPATARSLGIGMTKTKELIRDRILETVAIGIAAWCSSQAHRLRRIAARPTGRSAQQYRRAEGGRAPLPQNRGGRMSPAAHADAVLIIMDGCDAGLPHDQIDEMFARAHPQHNHSRDGRGLS